MRADPDDDLRDEPDSSDDVGGWPDPTSLTCAPQDVARALSLGVCPDDRVFDQFMPESARRSSSHFWTPVAVAWLAAHWLVREGARTVLDVGSGVGKFSLVAAMSTPLEVLGVEHRASLVAVARRLASTFAIQERVRFAHATFGAAELPAVDGYYAYNPFGENLFEGRERLDDQVELCFDRFRRDTRAFNEMLHRSPVGTVLVTYNGLGGRIPRAFSLVSETRAFQCPLRLWRRDSGESGFSDQPEEPRD